MKNKVIRYSLLLAGLLFGIFLNLESLRNLLDPNIPPSSFRSAKILIDNGDSYANSGIKVEELADKTDGSWKKIDDDNFLLTMRKKDPVTEKTTEFKLAMKKVETPKNASGTFVKVYRAVFEDREVTEVALNSVVAGFLSSFK